MFSIRNIRAVHSQRRFATLVLSEHFEGKLANNLSNVLSAVKHFKDDKVDVLVHGNACAEQVEEVKKYKGINKIYFANNPDLQNPYGDAIVQLTKKLVETNNYDKVVAASSGFGKDVIPRLGGLLDVQPITDVIEIIDAGAKFKRPIYAGNAVATVSTSDSIKLLTVRTTNFDRQEKGAAAAYATEEVSFDNKEIKGKWLENQASKSETADLGSAKFVVSGGRGMKNGENFKLLHDFAGALGSQNCAIGASRAAVDAGFVPNDMQVGQTGKVVAPDLYVAVGISGAIQHLSGMKDSKIIVAINKDPDAPIFKVSNYGIVGDLFKVLPELTEKIKQ